MQLLLFTVFGFVVGVALYAALPALHAAGHEMGTKATTALGLFGSYAGWTVGPGLSSYELHGLHPAGFVASVLCACTMLMVGDHLSALMQTTLKSAGKTDPA